MTLYDHHWITGVYVFFIILWICILCYFQLFSSRDWIQWFIILIPFIAFIIAISFSHQLTGTVENFAFRTNILSLGIIIVLPLIIWIAEKYSGDKRKLLQLLTLAIVFSLLSLIDYWVSERYLCVVKHIKSALQTMAITLLIVSIYTFFLHDCLNSWAAPNDVKSNRQLVNMSIAEAAVLS